MDATWSDAQVAYVVDAGAFGSSFADLAAREDEQWRKLERVVREMRHLGDDWDGEGADAPRASVVDSVLHLVSQLRERGMAAPSRAVVSPNGAIVLEWQGPGGVYVEAQISVPYRVEWMRKRADRPAEHWDDRWQAPRERPEDPCHIESDIWEGYLIPA
jgi:hypothetical protein